MTTPLPQRPTNREPTQASPYGTTRPPRPRRPVRKRFVGAGVALTLAALAIAGFSSDDTTEAAASTTEPGVTTTAPQIADDLAAPLDDPDATGRELAQRFLDILGDPNPAPLLEEFLSPAFQLQRSNGTFANKAEYVDHPASVARFTILDDAFRAYQDGRALTVRFRVSIEEEIDGAQLRVSEADRLGVFLRTADGWQLLAWSNFIPVAP
jgi:hypothetical protein